MILSNFNLNDGETVSIDSVRSFLAAHAPDIAVIELAQSTATVELAAAGHGVAPGQIAKTLSLRVGDRVRALWRQIPNRLPRMDFEVVR